MAYGCYVRLGRNVPRTRYSGRKKKPDFYIQFKTEERREEYIKQWLTRLENKVSQSEARQAEKRAFKTTLIAGDILYGSWGYEQTNIDFYQVIEVSESKKSVVIRRVSGNKSYDSNYNDRGSVVPMPDRFIGDSITKRVSPGERISYSSGASLSKWGGGIL